MRPRDPHSVSRLAGSFSCLWYSLSLKGGPLSRKIVEDARLQCHMRIAREIKAMLYPHLGKPGPEVARISKSRNDQRSKRSGRDWRKKDIVLSSDDGSV